MAPQPAPSLQWEGKATDRMTGTMGAWKSAVAPGADTVIIIIMPLHGETRPDGRLVGGDQGGQEGLQADFPLFCRGQNGRKDHRSGVSLDEPMPVVDIQGVGGQTVGQHRSRQ